jgi:hypothetical protein
LASGTISDQARTRIAGFCRSERFGENVYFLDGDRLESLERSASYRADREARGLLLAFQNELVSNIRRLGEIEDHLKRGETRVLSKCRITALEAVLSSSASEDLLPYDVIEPIWILMDCFNNLVTMSALSRSMTKDEIGFLDGWTPGSRKRCQEALAAVQSAIRQLDNRHDLMIDVNPPSP